MSRKIIICLAVTNCIFSFAYSQLTGTKNIPGDYPDLASAISALNTQGVGVGGVTLNLIAGNSQTAPAGGYVIGGPGSLVLASTSSTKQVIIQGNGNTITAFSPQAAGATNDGVFKIIGGDYITIRNFTIQENASNTNAIVASNNMTEWGVALLYASTSDGAQNNSITNNNISLNKIYQNSFGVYSNTRHHPDFTGTLAEITTSAGSNSGNKFFSNAISNTAIGIALISAQTLSNFDTFNEVGNSPATGNTVSNFGNSGGATSFSGISANVIAGIYLSNGKDLKVNHNTVTTSITVSSTVYGIQASYSGATSNNGTNEIGFNSVSLSVTGTGNLTGIGLLSTGQQTCSDLLIRDNQVINNSIQSGLFTGIFNQASANNISILGNICRSNLSSATTKGFKGIYNKGTGSVSLNINSNEIGNSNGGAITFSTATTDSIIAITNQYNYSPQVHIDNNTIQGFNLVSSGAFYGISMDFQASGNMTYLDGNKLGTASGGLVSFSAAQPERLRGISIWGGGNTISMSSNDFRGIVYNVTSASDIILIENRALNVTHQFLDHNTFTGLSINSTGDLDFIYADKIINQGGSCSVSFNKIINGFSVPGAGGYEVRFLAAYGGGEANTTGIYEGNEFSDAVLGNPGGVLTIMHFPNTVVKYIRNNIIRNVNATRYITSCLGASGNNFYIENNLVENVTASHVSGIGGNGNALTTIGQVKNNIVRNITATETSAYGITSGGNGPLEIFDNNVSNILGAYQGFGIQVSGATMSIYRNKIFDITSNYSSPFTSFSATGINAISPAGNLNIYNNFIGSINAPNAVVGNFVRGMDINTSGNANIFYNTVLINASGSGNFGSSAFYWNRSMFSNGTLTLRNNIFVNLSAASGSGKSVAFQKNTNAPLSSYSSTSNNNLFYAGIPSSSNLIYYDGTNSDQGLLDWKSRVSPRDNAAVSENPVFLSTAGSSPDFLHINPAVSTQAESGGQPIPGFTTDYDGDLRNASTPDIGADEFNSAVPTCFQPNQVSVTNITSNTATVIFNAGGNSIIVEYGPAGFTPGTGSSPGTNGTIVQGNGSPVQITGLSSSTSYDVYVRRVCTSPPYSINSTVFNFSTLHMYEEAVMAGALTVGAVCTGAPYSTLGAGSTVNELSPSCSGNKQTPIWFKFIAPASGAVRVSTDMGTPTMTDSKIALYSATNPNDYTTFTIISCDDDGGSAVAGGLMSVLYATNLVPGNTYYIALDRSNGAIAHGSFCITVDELSNAMLSTNTNCINSFQQPTGTNSYTGYVPLLDANSKLIALARVPGGGPASGFTIASEHINAGPIRSSSGTEYLDRNYFISNPVINAFVKFFFLTTELNSLIAADPSVNFSNLGAVRQEGPNCINDFSPVNGWTSFLPQTSSGISADGSVRWIEVNTPSFSNFYLKGALGGALPLNLTAFSGYRQGTNNILSWTTTNETNNRGFEIQRSLDGINFTPVAFVNSLAPGGSSSNNLLYRYADPATGAGKYYYRLNQVDLNNNYKFSNIIILKGEIPAKLSIAGVYPNPVSDQLKLTVETPGDLKIRISITDQLGQTCLNQEARIQVGSNTIEFNTSMLTAGIYSITITDTGKNYSVNKKFIKH